jgi:integrase
MRAGELFGLQWNDIDRAGRCIHVRRSASRRRIETPKSHLQRRIDLSDDLGRVLDTLRTRRKEDWFRQAKSMPEWVFCTEDGNFVNEHNFRARKFYPFVRSGKLRRFRLHDLRHTYASIMLQNGESPAYVKEQMGHYSIQMTVDTYGHLIPGANRAAANRLGTSILTAQDTEAKSAAGTG